MHNIHCTSSERQQNILDRFRWYEAMRTSERFRNYSVNVYLHNHECRVHIHTEKNKTIYIYIACLGGAVGSVAVHAAWLRWSASLGSRPRLARSLCQVIAAYALRLNSWAGTEGSTVSSLICDRWLIFLLSFCVLRVRFHIKISPVRGLTVDF